MSKRSIKRLPTPRVIQNLVDVKLNHLIFTALGEVSVAWEPRPAGVFQSSEAQRIGYKLREDIKDLIRKL